MLRNKEIESAPIQPERIALQPVGVNIGVSNTRLHDLDKCASLIAEGTATGEATMSSSSWREMALASGLLAGLVWVAPAVPAVDIIGAVPTEAATPVDITGFLSTTTKESSQ